MLYDIIILGSFYNILCNIWLCDHDMWHMTCDVMLTSNPKSKNKNEKINK